MAGNVLELRNALARETMAVAIAKRWDEWQSDRRAWLADKKELRQYLFATDTTQTTNSKLPWKNKTTIPKLTQIRDNLHSNYLSALFPNDNWMKWEGKDESSETKAKKAAITTYLKNKTQQDNFRTKLGHLLLDYIDYGIAIADVEWVEQYKEDPDTGEQIPEYIGPRVKRVSPLDIVFNPMATTFQQSPKITRYLKNIGELIQEYEDYPEKKYYKDAIDKATQFRGKMNGFNQSDINKIAGFVVDGFGSAFDYYQSGVVEILEFEGDYYDYENNVLERNKVITIIDRSYILRNETSPSWISGSLKTAVNWRERPDNLWGMGPLDNLVGMQYRLDHLENAKADAMDLAIYPPMMIKGNVEEFDWRPGGRIYTDMDGDAREMGTNLNGVMAAASEAAAIEAKMEEMAGAPKQAMGFRTPGEKTAFEVQQLMNAASRIFQEKITTFEINFLEPILNKMLEVSRRNMSRADLARVIDDDVGAVDFMTITKSDITAVGTVRAMGARHFSAVSQLVQNINGIAASPIMQLIAPHISGKAMYKMLEDQFQLERFGLFKDNIAVIEHMETQKLAGEAQQQLQSQAQQPGLEGNTPVPEQPAQGGQ